MQYVYVAIRDDERETVTIRRRIDGPGATRDSARSSTERRHVVEYAELLAAAAGYQIVDTTEENFDE